MTIGKSRSLDGSGRKTWFACFI